MMRVMARPTRGVGNLSTTGDERSVRHNSEADDAVGACVVIIRDQRRAVEASPDAHADYSRRFVA
jgi:hypothetical protein